MSRGKGNASGVQDHASAALFLSGSDVRHVSGIRSTSIVRHVSGDISVRYHATAVVTYRADGSAVLASGGYRTPTTKDRMKKFTNVNLFAKRKAWYVALTDNPHGPVKVFVDGMIIPNSLDTG